MKVERPAWLKRWLATAPDVDDVREEAARVCEETARYERGERGRLLNSLDDGILAEFGDDAFGVASEVALIAADGLQSTGARWRVDQPWDTAARMLRAGWRRGQEVRVAVMTGAQN